MYDSKKLGKCLTRATRVRIRGKERRRSLRDLAIEIGVSYSTLSRIGKGGIPDLGTYEKVCQYFHVSLDEFIIKGEG